MGLSCGMKCLQFTLFAFNFIIWVCGLAVLGVGIWSRIKLSDWDSIFDDSTIPSAANLMIAAGVFVTILGFLGCCGAWKKSKCMLITYAVCLMLIFVLEIAAGIYAYVKRDDVVDKLKEALVKGVKTTYRERDNKADEGFKDAFDWLQENLECCGAANSEDWKTSTWANDTIAKNLAVPKSCCKDMKATACNANPFDKLKYWPKGCVDEGETFVKDHMAEIGGVGVGIAFIQFIGILFAILLCRAVDGESV